MAVSDVQRRGYNALLGSVRAASEAAHGMTPDDVERHAACALEQLTTALDAGRACLCMFQPDWSRDVVAHFVTGGHEEIGAVGPAFLGVGIEEVPEWTDAELAPRVHRRGSTAARTSVHGSATSSMRSRPTGS